MRRIEGFGQHGGFHGPETDAKEHNRTILLNAGLTFAICVFFASLLPRELLAASLESLFHIAAVASGIVAAIKHERLPADRLTNWDVAAIFLGLSIIAGGFVDPEAIQSVLGAAPALKGAPAP